MTCGLPPVCGGRGCLSSAAPPPLCSCVLLSLTHTPAHGHMEGLLTDLPPTGQVWAGLGAEGSGRSRLWAGLAQPLVPSGLQGAAALWGWVPRTWDHTEGCPAGDASCQATDRGGL